jgi:hypothetical protein
MLQTIVSEGIGAIRYAKLPAFAFNTRVIQVKNNSRVGGKHCRLYKSNKMKQLLNIDTQNAGHTGMRTKPVV